MHNLDWALFSVPLLLAFFTPWLCRLRRIKVGALSSLFLLLLFVLLLLSRSTLPLAFQVKWFPSLNLRFALLLDPLSYFFSALILGIGSFVFYYADGYFEESPERGRFFSLLSLFTGSMLGLVLADNFFLLFIFWELTSLSSYLLIGFEHAHPAPRQAALQALLVTALGGLALLTALLLIQQATGALSFSTLLAHPAGLTRSPLFPAILFLFLLGVATKSAQFPFHFWLPNAMEAPTPASAYLHAATMVNAGVYLLARVLPLFAQSPLWCALFLPLGSATLLVGGVLSLFQNEIKRLLAYATVAALGAMVSLLGLGTPLALRACLVYLLAHALYKGALFFFAGAFQRIGSRKVSDLRGLAKRAPLLSTAALLAGASLAGIPPWLGFFGKELLYEASLEKPLFLSIFLIGHIFLTASVALLVLPQFFQKEKEDPSLSTRPNLVKSPLLLGTLALSLCSLLLGIEQALFSPLFHEIAAPLTPPPPALHIPTFSRMLEYSFPQSQSSHPSSPAFLLLLSLATLGGGALLFWLTWSDSLRSAAQTPLSKLSQKVQKRLLSTEYAYHFLLQKLQQLALFQTAVLQNGSLRKYLAVTLIATLFFVALGMSATPQPSPLSLPSFHAPPLYELLLALLMVAATIQTARAGSWLGSALLLGVVGYSIAALFLIYGAPDLAITQFSIESLTVILFVFLLYKIPPYAPLSSSRNFPLNFLTAAGVGLFITLSVLWVSAAKVPSELAPFFVQEVLAAHGRNIVNVILVDFRGFDTLGEITVLAAAGIGIFALTQRRSKAP